MGGVIILAGMILTTVLFARWTPDLILCVAATIATGLLGLLDDVESVSHGRSLGLTPSQKMLGLIVISVSFCLLAVNWVGVPPTITFPGGFTLDLGVLGFNIGGVSVPWLYLIFVFLLGYYPLAKPKFERIRPAVLRIVCKLLLCNAAVLAMYGLLLVLIPAGSISQELRTTAWIVTLSTLAMGNVAFLLYDRALHNLLMLYRLVWQPKLHRMLGMH